MKRSLATYLVTLAVATLFGCDTNHRFDHDKKAHKVDAGSDASAGPNVCELSKCKKPAMGIACCTPLAQCGMDPTGTGLQCVPNPGSRGSDLVCDLADCPKPTSGSACCTPFAQCGFDPFSSGFVCFANPPTSTATDDAGVCDPTTCPKRDDDLAACCLPNGKCGVDTFSNGLCFPPPPEPTDASVPVVSTEPPDDPSVTGECPSFLGPLGPIWGCCSKYGVCGTFTTSCLLPVGTQIPVDNGEDAGPLTYPRCTPPKK